MSLQFGIPSLDDLIQSPKSRGSEGQERDKEKSESLAILGPDGTGKSVLALHLASRYAADCDREAKETGAAEAARQTQGEEEQKERPARILYISSDLRHSSAEKVWENFALYNPNTRHIPFERSLDSVLRSESIGKDGRDPTAGIKLWPLKPETDNLVAFLMDEKPVGRIGFLDLASRTAGDDWNLVNALLVKLRSISSEGTLPHLVIIDSVAGFETFVGRLDAFGNEQSRRARIAQCIRNAGERVHLVFVVEEPHPTEHLPEEYVTDIVLRLRSRPIPGDAIRTVEIEKARAREHAKGEHPFEIRSKKGTSTGSWENADTPLANNAYVQIFHSIAHRNRRIVADYAKPMVQVEPKGVCFGLDHLDDLFSNEQLPVSKSSGGSPEVKAQSKGIRAGNTAAIIGNPGTHKSVLGERFLAEGFRELAKDFADLYLLKKNFENAKISSVQATYHKVANLLARCTLDKDSALEEASGAIPKNWLKEFSKAANSGRENTQRHIYQVFKYQGAVKPTLLDLAKKLEVRERASKLAVAKVVGVPEGTAKPPESRARWTMNWEQIIHQQDLVELFRHENLRYPGLLLTTSDINGDDLAEKCYHHMRYAVGKLADDPEFKRQLMEVLKSQLIVRRFDMQGLPAAAVFQIIQRNVVEAQKLIFGIAYPPERETRKLKSERIRVVIDDLQVLTKLNPEIIQDGAFFPFLTFFLQREGVTSLLIHTDSLRPSTPAVEATSQALLAILKVAIFTWNVPFEGRSRVAIGVNAYNNAKNGVVRELMVGAKDSPIVTRQFELYTGIEEGKPVPVPLAVYIFNETPQFLAYIDEEDRLFREMFSSVEPSSAVNPGRVIFPVDGPRYMAMRDYTHLALDAQDGHSMIFQVDEFWALQEPHTLQALTEYMAEELPAPDGGSNSGDEERNLKDPFQLFWGEPLTLTEKPAGESGFRRSDFFENSGYKFEPKGEKHYRVPFMWDFGFLLLRNGPWEIARSEKLFAEKIIGMGQSVGYLMSEKAAVAKARKKIEEIIPLADKKTPVSAVQEGIEKGISWRKFLGACSKVAEVYSRQTGVNTTPFDVASPSSETMNTLLLEIWLSEVKVEAEILGYTLAPEDSKSLVHLLTRTHAGCREKLTEDLFREFATEAKAWGRDIDWNTRVKAFRKLPIGALCLYKTWLLLIEAFAFEDFLEPDNPFSLRQGRTAALHSAASRHWYKTACAFASELAHSVGIDDSLVAQRLPGHYSTRGDWYLASPQSSRSQLLAQRALDLLCSRRANLTRMQRGLGLPVRDVLQMGRCEKLRTALRCKQPRKRTGAAAVKRAGGESEQTLTELTYLDLVSLGRGSDLEWLKRSEIKDYDRVSRPLQKWLVRLFRWTGEYKRESDRHWRGGFPGYDDITCKSFEVVQNYKSFEYFGELCDFLVDELNAAVRKRQVDLPNPQGPLKKKAATA